MNELAVLIATPLGIGVVIAAVVVLSAVMAVRGTHGRR